MTYHITRKSRIIKKISHEIVNALQNTNLTITTALNVNFFESESDNNTYQKLLNKNLKICKWTT